jgi:uncharacterized protein
MSSQDSIKLEFSVPIKMRDGINLCADIYRPDSDHRHPAILVRLPYKKLFFSIAQNFSDFQRMARAGYSVIIQDCRGTGTSNGEFYPQSQDPEDGYDRAAWIASQLGCDGNYPYSVTLPVVPRNEPEGEQSKDDET